MFKIDPCVENCCNDAQIVLLPNFGNSTNNEPSEVCCYKLNIMNVSCPIDSIKIYKSGQTLPIESTNGKDRNPIDDLENYSAKMENWICQTPGGTHPDTIRIVLKDMNGDSCVKTVLLPACNNSCCDSLEVSVLPNPVRDDGFECCYQFTFDIRNSKCSILKNIDISSNGNPIWKSPDYYEGIGLKTEYICIPSSMQNGQPLPLSIKFFNSSGMLMCEKTTTVLPCLKPVTAPCSPDHQENNGGWVKNPDQTFPKKTIRFRCPHDTSIYCDVVFTYTYRYFETPDTMRDIQPLSYTVGGNCVCDLEIRNQILLAILNDPQVKEKFELDTNTFNPGEIRCYDNFRVVTGDCWDSTYFPPSWNGPFLNRYGYYTKRRCADTVCCYQKYHVCYKKDENGNVKVLENSIENISGYYYPQACESNDTAHCIPDNCKNWYLGPPMAIIRPVDVKEIVNSEGCNISLFQNLHEDFLNVSINCAKSGLLKIEIYDILGNCVSFAEDEKRTIYFSTKIVLNLTTGAYFCKVSLNDEIYSYRKIIIIK